jgi:hypothetical protein
MSTDSCASWRLVRRARGTVHRMTCTTASGVSLAPRKRVRSSGSRSPGRSSPPSSPTAGSITRRWRPMTRPRMGRGSEPEWIGGENSRRAALIAPCVRDQEPAPRPDARARRVGAHGVRCPFGVCGSRDLPAPLTMRGARPEFDFLDLPPQGGAPGMAPWRPMAPAARSCSSPGRRSGRCATTRACEGPTARPWSGASPARTIRAPNGFKDAFNDAKGWVAQGLRRDR